MTDFLDQMVMFGEMRKCQYSNTTSGFYSYKDKFIEAVSIVVYEDKNGGWSYGEHGEYCKELQTYRLKDYCNIHGNSTKVSYFFTNSFHEVAEDIPDLVVPRDLIVLRRPCCDYSMTTTTIPEKLEKWVAQLKN